MKSPFTSNSEIILLENLILKRFEDKLVVVSDEEDPKKQRGETFRNKEKLKAAGFRWNSYINSWTIHQSQLQQAQQILAKINNSPIEKFITKVEELPEMVLGADNLSKKDELVKKIEGFVEELAGAVDEAAASETIRKFLEFNAKFRGYSWHNTLLIYLQKPDATKVAGFKQWEEKFHRRVKKGAKAISILAPIKVGEKKKDDKPETTPTTTSTTSDTGDTGDESDVTGQEVPKQQSIMRFIAVSVFDISDTEPIDARGEIPATPEWHGSNEPNEKANELYQAAYELAEDLGIKLTVGQGRGGEQGWASGGHINITSNIDGVNKAATLIHEIAHELLHFKKSSPFYVGDIEDTDTEKPIEVPRDKQQKKSYVLTRAIAELQAESVSFVVIKYFNLPVQHQATYLALWKANKDTIRENLTVIKKCADFIIGEIEKIQNAKAKQTPAAQAPVAEQLFECIDKNRFKLRKP